ncbi:MAG TPA: hypothetical protein VFX35_01400 [Solirubrobacterales bacterium]|nr:hypothetical protein [Solirubrobacterales bacterium]
MSALTLYRVKAGTASSVCTEPRCPNKGRFQIFFAGHLCRNRFGSPELLCEKHGKEWLQAIKVLAPSEQLVTQTLGALAGAPSKRCDAVDLLRSFGLSPEQVARAVKETSGGKSPEQVLEGLAGEREVVAA